ncbi:MAG: hypothetical protein LBN24_10580 [Mediterranea sp.]|nr:hypothetical protein [Mediterranea sp.]
MKKNIPFKRVIPTCLLFAAALALSACGSEESNKEIPTPGAYRTLTIRPSESFGQESDNTRGLVEPQVTRTDLGDGMILEASVVPDDDADKAATRVANPIADDVEICTIVYNPANERVFSAQNLTVKNSQLTLEIPQSEVSIIFFSPYDRSSPIFETGERCRLTLQWYAKDYLWYKGTIPAGTSATSLGPVTLKHLLAQVRTEITAPDRSILSNFVVWLYDVCAGQVNIRFPSGETKPAFISDKPSDFNISASGGSSSKLTSNYFNMMPASEALTTYTLRIYSMTIGNKTIIDKFTTVTAAFATGHRYKIKLNVKPAA